MPNYQISEGRHIDGGFAIYPNSLLFKAGDYADKGIVVTENDLRNAADKFAPLEFNSEHDTHGVHKAVLSGIGKHLGGMGGPRRVWIDPAAPDTLRGEVAVPLWLDSELESKSLSMEIDRATKLFTGAGLTYTPRVSEAALMSACVNFAMTRHNTPEGQSVMQDLHDMSARAGAVCDRTNAAKMASQHEATAVQKIHDIATDHGADCKSGDKPAYYFKKDTKNMNAWEKLVAFCSGHGMPEEDAAAILAEPPAQFTAPGMTAEEKAQFSQLIADNARLKAEGVAKDAAQFADAMIADCRAYPAEKPALVASFCQAAADDAEKQTVVKFSITEGGQSVEKTGGRLDAFRALVGERPKHGLTTEQLKASFAEGAVLPPREKSGEAADKAKVQEDYEKFLASTDVGRAIAADKSKN